VIRSFADKDTERIWHRIRVRRWSNEVQRAAYRKLLILDAAEAMNDLKAPPGNRLEKLSGRRRRQWSIRINDQWRICFDWRNGDVYEVEITDYH
jgi:proteic killer suppression protein